MTILLDTQLLLWSQVETDRLPVSLAEELEDLAQVPTFSIVSIWEVVIKSALNRPDFNHDAALLRSTLLDLGWRELELAGNHVLAVSDLQSHHGDPFDRALVAQAKAEGMELVTTDETLNDYGSHVRIVKGRKIRR
jgi:PIN domain nuclease of toxin-antitoxin system